MATMEGVVIGHAAREIKRGLYPCYETRMESFSTNVVKEQNGRHVYIMVNGDFF